jgi:hypothetical protein
MVLPASYASCFCGDRLLSDATWGQDAGLIKQILPAAEIVSQIADEAERILSNKLPRLLR